MSEQAKCEVAWNEYYDLLLPDDKGGVSWSDFNAGYLAGLRRAEERMMAWWGDDAENEVPMSEKDVFMRVRGLLKEIIKELE